MPRGQSSRPASVRQGQLLATYRYRDERGRTLYEVRRYAPKTFAQFRPAKGGRWIKGLGSVRRVPYHLPELIAARDAGNKVYLVEGEKDADRLADLGYTVSCSKSGPGVFQKEWLSYFSAEQKIAIIADADKAGYRDAQRAYDLIQGHVHAVNVYECLKGKDVSEHLDNGGKLGSGQFKNITTLIQGMGAAGATNGTGTGTGTDVASASSASVSSQAALCADWALAKLWDSPPTGALHNGRAAVAFKFAEQLRDVDPSVAREAMRIFVMACPAYSDDFSVSPYSMDAAMDTLKHALTDVPPDWTAGVFANGSLSEEEWEELILPLSSVESASVRWLWKRRFPYGKVCILEGDPDVGKSTITLDIAARVTRGDYMPDATTMDQPDRQNVLVISTEDDLEDTVVPRLSVAGADLSHMYSLLLQKDERGNAVPLFFPEDVPRLKHAIRKHNCGLVIIDPITNYLSEKIQSHNDASVRRAMTPLAQVAAETGACVLMVRHLNKSGDMKKAKYRGAGSIAFTGAARAVFVVERHPEDPAACVMAKVKMNLTASGVVSLAYSLVAKDEVSSPKVQWLGPVGIDADALLSVPDSRKDAHLREEACSMLRELLEEGERDSSEVRRVMESGGISWSTVKRVKSDLKVVSMRARDEQGRTKGWIWKLPERK